MALDLERRDPVRAQDRNLRPRRVYVLGGAARPRARRETRRLRVAPRRFLRLLLPPTLTRGRERRRGGRVGRGLGRGRGRAVRRSIRVRSFFFPRFFFFLAFFFLSSASSSRISALARSVLSVRSLVRTRARVVRPGEAAEGERDALGAHRRHGVLARVRGGARHHHRAGDGEGGRRASTPGIDRRRSRPSVKDERSHATFVSGSFVVSGSASFASVSASSGLSAYGQATPRPTSMGCRETRETVTKGRSNAGLSTWGGIHCPGR